MERFAHPHKTAITRNRISAPTRYLTEQGLIKGRTLDFGCGKGFDADTFGWDKYDPYFAPTEPQGPYDTIVCHYVLNVIPEAEERPVLRRLEALLAPGGTAYITVRRDATTMSGKSQRLVHLKYPTLVENKGFCIYVLRK